MLETLCSQFRPEDLGWIVWGHRFHPELKEILTGGLLPLWAWSFLACGWKNEAFFDLRQEVFNFCRNLKTFQDRLYFCMEPDFMWQECGLSHERLNHRLHQNGGV